MAMSRKKEMFLGAFAIAAGLATTGAGFASGMSAQNEIREEAKRLIPTGLSPEVEQAVRSQILSMQEEKIAAATAGQTVRTSDFFADTEEVGEFNRNAGQILTADAARDSYYSRRNKELGAENQGIVSNTLSIGGLAVTMAGLIPALGLLRKIS